MQNTKKRPFGSSFSPDQGSGQAQALLPAQKWRDEFLINVSDNYQKTNLGLRASGVWTIFTQIFRSLCALYFTRLQQTDTQNELFFKKFHGTFLREECSSLERSWPSQRFPHNFYPYWKGEGGGIFLGSVPLFKLLNFQWENSPNHLF